jgi:hypothetical protein
MTPKQLCIVQFPPYTVYILFIYGLYVIRYTVYTAYVCVNRNSMNGSGQPYTYIGYKKQQRVKPIDANNTLILSSV